MLLKFEVYTVQEGTLAPLVYRGNVVHAGHVRSCDCHVTHIFHHGQVETDMAHGIPAENEREKRV